jgi:hypothetical protein
MLRVASWGLMKSLSRSLSWISWYMQQPSSADCSETGAAVGRVGGSKDWHMRAAGARAAAAAQGQRRGRQQRVAGTRACSGALLRAPLCHWGRAHLQDEGHQPEQQLPGHVCCAAIGATRQGNLLSSLLLSWQARHRSETKPLEW